jgi:hypothetical protein
VEVDQKSSAENVERALRDKGRQVAVVKNESGYTLEVAAG